MYNGFTPSVSKKVLDAIELATLTIATKNPKSVAGLSPGADALCTLFGLVLM